MSLRKLPISGRVSVVALAALALLVLTSGLVLSRKASAQNRGNQHVMTFAPVLVDPPDPERKAGGDNVLIGLLLPAVQRGVTPFRVEVMMGDGSVRVLSNPPEPDRTASFFDVFFTNNVDQGGLTLHLKSLKTGEEVTAPAPDTSVAIRILPAVQKNGDALQPLSGGLTVSGHRDAVMGDGSVVPIPFQYGMEGPEERQS